MLSRESLNLNQAPETGYILAYFRTGVIFEKYHISVNQIKSSTYEKYNADDLLELHLFDAHREYRAIWSRRKQDYIIAVVEDEQFDCSSLSDDQLAEEEELIEVVDLMKRYHQSTGLNQIEVHNRLAYDENDMIHVINYRLAPVFEKEATK